MAMVRPVRTARMCLLGAMVMFASTADAFGGSELVSLAASGRFVELANGLESLAERRALGVPERHALCYAYSRIKRYHRIFACLDELAQALQARDRRTRLFGLEDATPTVFVMRADALIELARFGDAVAQAEAALDWYRRERSDDRVILVEALAAKTLAQWHGGWRNEAAVTAAALDEVPVGWLDTEFAGAKSLAVARVSLAMGRWQKVLDALASDRTLGLRVFLDQLATGAYLRGVSNWVWMELPRAYMQNKALMELGRVSQARDHLDAMLAVQQIAANTEVHWLALHDRGRIAMQDGHWDLARRLLSQAAEVIERQRASIHTETNKIGFVGDKQSVYGSLLEAYLREGNHDGAFETVERAKSRALVDLLASRTSFASRQQMSGGGTDLARKVAQLDLLQVRNREQAGLAPRELRSPATDADAVSLLGDLPSELRSLVSVEPLQAAEVRALLQPDEALVTFHAHGGAWRAVVLRRSGSATVELQADGMESDIRALRDALDRRAEVVPTLHKLHHRLILPLAPHLQGINALTVVPHGVLHYLPFAALHDGASHMVDRFDLRVLPSASVLKYLRPSRMRRVEGMLLLGNPDLGDPAYDLPGAQKEIESLAALLPASRLRLGKQASKQAFIEEARHAPFIHIASHGEFDASRPLSSALFLAADGIDAGRLTIADLYQLELDAELVTLSACDTGLGQVASGDDVVGLTRGFLYAGASSVIASLWKVDDVATLHLMTSLYRHLGQAHRSEALRQAQLETRARFGHPAYWAAFYLTGQR